MSFSFYHCSFVKGGDSLSQIVGDCGEFLLEIVDQFLDNGQFVNSVGIIIFELVLFVVLLVGSQVQGLLDGWDGFVQ
jgi:hypothetical protein